MMSYRARSHVLEGAAGSGGRAAGRPGDGDRLLETVQQAIKRSSHEQGLGPADPLPVGIQRAQEMGICRSSVREAVRARFFHRALGVGLANGLLLPLLDVFREVHRRLREAARLVPDQDPPGSWQDRRRILEALEQGDPAGAYPAMPSRFDGIRVDLRRCGLRERASRTAPPTLPGGRR